MANIERTGLKGAGEASSKDLLKTGKGVGAPEKDTLVARTGTAPLAKPSAPEKTPPPPPDAKAFSHVAPKPKFSAGIFSPALNPANKINIEHVGDMSPPEAVGRLEEYNPSVRDVLQPSWDFRHRR